MSIDENHADDNYDDENQHDHCTAENLLTIMLTLDKKQTDKMSQDANISSVRMRGTKHF